MRRGEERIPRHPRKGAKTSKNLFRLDLPPATDSHNIAMPGDVVKPETWRARINCRINSVIDVTVLKPIPGHLAAAVPHACRPPWAVHEVLLWGLCSRNWWW